MATKVTLVDRNDKMALVEYKNDEGKRQRVQVLRERVKRNDDGDYEVDPRSLDSGIPYGVDWSQHIEPLTLTPEQVRDTLYEAGIWTPNDVYQNPQAIVNALLGAMAVNVNHVIQAARKHEEETNHGG